MSIEALKNYLTKIKPLNKEAMKKAKERLESLAKPPGSLGKLEDIAEQLAGIFGSIEYKIEKRCVIIMASDNGVVEEGVASAPQSVTSAQTVNFTKGITGVAVLAKIFNTDLIVVDMGINDDIDNIQIINKKIRKSTWNIAKGKAMTYEEAVKAVLIGIETAVEAVKNGYTLLGAGEMGIGNTTTSSAVLCALTGLDPEKTSGKGAGLSESAYLHKINVIKKALIINKPDSADPIDILAKVGGFDIAAMTGIYIGAAMMGVPIVIDGFISITAALIAARLNPLTKEYMFASHASYERGYEYASRELGLEPCLNMGMRLGEGSGCPLMFMIMDAACAVIKDMGTFAQAHIDDEYLNEINGEDSFAVSEKK